MTEDIAVTKEGRVLTVVLSRPERKNALTNGMHGVLAPRI